MYVEWFDVKANRLSFFIQYALFSHNPYLKIFKLKIFFSNIFGNQGNAHTAR